jgi:hypothetical protein
MKNPNSLSGRAVTHLLRAVRLFKSLLKTNRIPLSPLPRPKIFVVVEGPHDIEFLRRISAMLHTESPHLPDLADMERRRELVFVPCGGGDPRLWAFRLGALGIREFHLQDRDSPPYTEVRQQAVDMVNWRPGCRAVLTKKRSIENYLDANAIFEASGIRVAFSDEDNVAEMVALASHSQCDSQHSWDALPARVKRRRLNTIKKWLNTRAVDRMTPERLAERDPDGEVRSWLMTIVGLANRQPTHRVASDS